MNMNSNGANGYVNGITASESLNRADITSLNINELNSR